MSYFITLIVIVLQLFVGQILGFGGAILLGVGNGWELVVIPLGNTLGVWGVGMIASIIRRQNKHAIRQFIGTATGAAWGIGLILLTPATGFSQVLYPLIGAAAGYTVMDYMTRRKEKTVP